MDRRADAHELLDGPLHDHDAVVANLRDLRRLNRLFGGVALSRWGVNRLLDGAAGTTTVLDVGTGGADIPVALLADARRRGRDLTVQAVDHRPEIVAAARSARPSLDHVAGLQLDVADGTALPYPDASFDVAHASLVVHHLDAEEAVRFLAELRRVSRLGVVVNELDRGRFAWTVTWLTTRLLARGRFTRHDAPTSVRRAYTARELEGLLRRAGLVPAATRTIPGHRYAVVAVPAE
ncbi:MAG TPA: methyltransferase domain-containing protein [Clostridia bacterium]|nr:methyltransferase domain-containing protein [Clostridia bacterium]